MMRSRNELDRPATSGYATSEYEVNRGGSWNWKSRYGSGPGRSQSASLAAFRLAPVLVVAVLVAVNLIPESRSSALKAAAPTSNPGRIVWRTDLKAAAREAAASRRPMLLQVTADWCGYCHKMFDQTFTDEQVARHINGCFVPVTVDADKEAGLVQAIGVEGLPTTVIVSPEFKVIKKVTGFRAAAALSRELDALCTVKHVAHTQPAASLPPQLTLPTETLPASAIPASQQETLSKPAEPSFGGLCLVSLRENRELRPGLAEFTIEYRGHVLRFDSAENKTRFEANPLKYYPMGDGVCPVTSTMTGTRTPGEAKFGALFQDRVVFLASLAARDAFVARPERYVSAQ